MSLTRLLVRNRHTVWALTIAAAVFGVAAYRSLPMQLFPDTAPPLVNVVTSWPGVSAVDVAESLSRPLEEEISTLEGIVEVRSTSQDNLSLVTAEFHYDVDVDVAAVDVQNAIARIRGELPAGTGEPQVLKFSTSDRPIVTFGVTGEDLDEVRREAEDVYSLRLMRVPGVAGVDVFGGARPAVIVALDRTALDAHRLGLAQVVATLEAHNVAVPAGRVRSERRETMLRLDERARDIDALRAIPIPTSDGSRVLLGDLGHVELSSVDDDARFAIDGTRAIAMQVFKATDANTVETVARTREVVQELRDAHPELEILEGEESASFTETSISSLLDNVWQALALAAAIVFLFLGRARRSLVAIISMPLAYGLTFALMALADVELNMVTLSAIILAVGMVVDASVVVLENVNRRTDEEGLDPESAAIEGTDEVRLAVLAGAGTTVVVLVPLLFLEGFVGATFGPLALTLLFAFSSSVVVALVLVPVLTLYTGGYGRLDRLGERVAGPFLKVMDVVRAAYVWLLEKALRFRVVTVLASVVLLVASVAGMRTRGMEVLPQMDTGSFFVSLETPSGSSLEHTAGVVGEIERQLGLEPDVTRIQSQVGFEAGMRSFGSTGAQGPTQGFISVTLTDRTEREETIWDIEERVRASIAEIPGIRTATVREQGNTAKSTTAAPIVVRVSGPDALVLDRLGDEALARIARVGSIVEPTRSWRIDQRRTRVRVDPLRASRLGLSPRAVATAMFAGSEGVPAGEYHDGLGAPLPVRVRYGRAEIPAPEQLLDYPVPSRQLTDAVPLRAVADLEDTIDQAVVTREHLSPTLDVTAFVRGRPLSFVLADVQASLAELVVPRGYEVSVSGEKDDLDDAKGELGSALGVAVIAVYLLLVAQFRSFVHPLTVLLSVPLSVAGVAGALALAGKPISMPVMVGLVLLVGIVVNNAIILVDFIRQRRDAGMPRREAVVESVRTRFRPIMMTSLSTIVGMIPLAAEWALGAERFSPLAIAVIGGMSTATFLTMVVIPVIYDLFDDLARLVRRER